MKISLGRLSICLLFFAVLMTAPLALAQDEAPSAPPAVEAAPAAPADQADVPAPAPQAAQSASGSSASSGSSFLPSLPGGGFDLLKGLAAFILVLALLYLCLKGLGRLGRFKGRGRESFFELRGIQALDNRKYLAAVEVDGRVIVVGVSPDRITPVAQWIAETEESDIDLSAAKLPTDEPGLQFKLPEEEDLPLDISIADNHAERPRK